MSRRGQPLRLRPLAGRLVRRLLVARGAAVTEDELVECFWPRLDLTAARANLQVTVHYARRALGPDRIERGEGTYRLALRPEDSFDAGHFEAAARKTIDEAGSAGLRAVLDGWREPLPEDRYADWAASFRAELAAMRLALALELSSRLRHAGKPMAAVPVMQPLYAERPLDEAVARELMASLAASGRRDEALALFERLRHGLLSAWSIDVDPETRLLAQAIGGGPRVAAALR